MILTRTVKLQLIGLAVASVVGLVVLGLVYLRIPEAVGYQRYEISASFERGAQLYEGAEVTYQGDPVGKVTDLQIAGSGITVTMSMREAVKVPTDVRAEIHSRSAVGEQYVDLVPVGTPASAGALTEGDSIPIDHTSLPIETGPLLDDVDALVESIPTDELNALLRETGTALDGRGSDLSTIIDSGGRFLDTADANLDQTRQLLDDFSPLSQAFTDRGDELDRATRNLADVTASLRASDGDLRTLLDQGPGFARETTKLLRDLNVPLQHVLARLGVTTESFGVYNDSFRNILSVYPSLTAAVQSLTLPFEKTNQVALDLTNLNTPAACLQGFIPPKMWRDPSDVSVTTTPRVYCDEPDDDPRVVKGARNLPCVRYPGVTAPTVELCREEAAGR